MKKKTSRAPNSVLSLLGWIGGPSCLYLNHIHKYAVRFTKTSPCITKSMEIETEDSEVPPKCVANVTGDGKRK